MLAFIDKDKHWYVVRTNVKAEAKAAENIRKVGYETYLPRRRVEVKNHKTHTYSLRESPLMPRYLFVSFQRMDANFYRVCSCDGVESILCVGGRPIRVSANSVETIFLAETDMTFDDTRAARIHRKEEAASAKENAARKFPVGRDILVMGPGNPFASFEGVVDEVTKAGKIIALIELFGRLTPVTFDPSELILSVA
ncbi:transcription termination/antitermination protein NusG [Phyllobacterium sp. 22229]|uniref:transcription termination/antitermination protein NusG n=1 Tax=Phyllobacterium sp. 22229 TaxID=3453895 RepID=UPI003F85CEBF